MRFFRSADDTQGSMDVAPDTPDIGADQLVYAIGDVHGRADLLARLIDQIVADAAVRAPDLSPTIILLGDLVDRGPDSRGVIEQAMQLYASATKCHFIMGNHEEMFMDAARGNAQAAHYFLAYGGKDTLVSYGFAPSLLDELEDEEAAQWMLAHIPRTHVDFVADFEDVVVIGDYAFVHAGIEPGVPMAAQSPRALRWIRGPFTKTEIPLPKWVVYGHSIFPEPRVTPWRIGIDTGAYASGVLTAIGLSGTQRWFLCTAD